MGIKKTETDSDFRLAVEAGGNCFALFYSAWCPYCIEFAPAFERQAGTSKAAFIEVPTDTLPALEDRFSVEVVPTVLFFSGGKLAQRLDGEPGRGLTAENLAAFIRACGETRKTEGKQCGC